MCGIVGFFQAARPAESFPPTIRRMLAMIRHRGPDELGYFFDERAALGAARLRIIDLAGGQQPLCDRSGRYWIAYNGEVYNYLELRRELERLHCSFSTHSDTEVVLNAYIAWGEAAFARLNGGFAFAIYDRVENRLHLVRDRYGKRPLYYARCGAEWVFASEIKCFLGHGGVPLAFNPAQIASILAVWTPLPEQSGYVGIHQVPAGAFLRIEGDHHRAAEMRPTPYYALDFQPARQPPADAATTAGTERLTLEEAAEQTRSLLAESVRLRLRSDVEVGAYLSGGLDSSITTLLAVQNSPHQVRTFSIGFAETDYDESNEQLLVSRQLGTAHTALTVSNQALAAAFPQALWHAEVPVFRTAFVPMYLLAQRVQAANIKVVLTGEGADEAFLGYDIFKETLVRQRWSQLASREEKSAELARLYPYLAHFRQNPASLVGVFDQYAEERLPGLFSHELRLGNSRFGLRLLKTDAGDGLDALRGLLAQHADELAPLSPLQRAQWLEFKTLLAGYLLSTQGDRMSFAHGVETRMPFLDPHVVHWAWALPDEWKLQGGQVEKYILKRAFAAELPAAIVQRPKQPYRAPDAAPFLEPDAPDYLELVLSTGELRKVDLIDGDFAQQLVHKLQQTPPSRISQRENQAFVFLLSLLLLHHQMVAGRRPGAWTELETDAALESLLVRRIDGRGIDGQGQEVKAAPAMESTEERA